MNQAQSTRSGSGLLKQVYPEGGKIAQMNQQMPMMQVLRAKRDALKKF